MLELCFNLFKLFKNNFLLKYKFYKVNKDFKFKNNINERTKYLKNINGFISIKNIFHLCRLRSMRFMFKDPILNINKEDIDLIISSSPLSLKKKGSNSADVIQIIHDAIPIQISNHPERNWIFFNRLKDAHKNSECLYVSKESRKIVKNILKIKHSKSNRNEIIYPMPSLQIELLEKAFKIPSIRSIEKSFILFNSSSCAPVALLIRASIVASILRFSFAIAPYKTPPKGPDIEKPTPVAIEEFPFVNFLASFI